MNLELRRSFLRLEVLDAQGEDAKFDSEVLQLSDELKFDPIIVETIASVYLKRKLKPQAEQIVNDAHSYHTRLSGVVPQQIITLKTNVTNAQVPVVPASPSVNIGRLSYDAETLKSLYSKIIPNLSPGLLVEVIRNDLWHFDFFCLYQIIRTLEDLLQQDGFLQNIEKFIGDENQMNILVGLLLSHRLSEWRWSVNLETPGGLSPNAKKRKTAKGGIGQKDFEICGPQNEKVAIIEALRLKSATSKSVFLHESKILLYDGIGADFGFILVYSSAKNFEKLWANYLNLLKSGVQRLFKPVGQNDPEDLSVSHKSTLSIPQAIRIARTTHSYNGRDKTIFHVAVDVGSRIQLTKKKSKKSKKTKKAKK